MVFILISLFLLQLIKVTLLLKSSFLRPSYIEHAIRTYMSLTLTIVADVIPFLVKPTIFNIMLFPKTIHAPLIEFALGCVMAIF